MFSRSRVRSGLVALPLLWAMGGDAGAQQAAPTLSGQLQGGEELKVVAVLPCDGKEAAVPPQKALERTRTARAVQELLRERPQAGRYKVLTAERWSEIARRRFHGRTTELQGIARELKADLEVGCWVEAVSTEGGAKPYRLTLALYNNWAEPLGQTTYEVDGPRLDPAALSPRADAFFKQLDYALGLIPPEPKRVPRGGARGGLVAVTQADDSEAAPLPSQQAVQGPGSDVPLVPPNAEARRLYYKRPPWRPLFDLQVGYLFNTRQLTDNGSGRSFNRSGASGLRLHGELYPLATLQGVPLGLAGLGFRVTALLPFWPDVKLVNERGEQTGLYSASEYRVEVGWLRWHYAFLSGTLKPEAPVHPEIELEGLYGSHRFDFTRKENILVLDIPNAGYSYLGAAAALKLHIARRLQLRAGLAFAGMLDLGQMAEPGAENDDPVQSGRFYRVYGPGGGWLWRTDLGLALRVAAGLHLNLGGYYEQKLLTFDGTGDVLLKEQPMQLPGGPPVAKAKVTSVKDEYGGFYVGLGYAY